MMPLNQSRILALAVSFALVSSCTPRQADTISSNGPPTDSQDRQAFSGEYLIGDGGAFIVPVGDVYEMRNENGETSQVLYFQGKEDDTVSVYSNREKSIVFRMNPDHKSGMCYEPDEQWPVSLVRRLEDENAAYAQLGTYDGSYQIQTESEGVNAVLELKYNGDRTFAYKWSFDVDVDEANCHAKREGALTMDRPQHGFDADGDCPIHFNFVGHDDGAYVVEFKFEDESLCKDLNGECIFSGTYKRR